MTNATEAFSPIREPSIVYDDHGLVVVAKPAGMHCAPCSEEGTLAAWLFGLRPELASVRGHGPGEGGLIHRLDAATSGLVAFAADDEAFVAVREASRSLRFEKRYLALARPGGFGLAGSRPLLLAPPGMGEKAWRTLLGAAAPGARRADPDDSLVKVTAIASRLAGLSVRGRFRPFGPGGARVACAAPDLDLASGKAWGKDAYESLVLSAEATDGDVFVELSLRRGFRHQLRAHMAWLGLALVGDETYGEGEYQGGDGGDDPGRDPSVASPGALGLRLRAHRLLLPSPRDDSALDIRLPALR